jgi:hypothetical protein
MRREEGGATLHIREGRGARLARLDQGHIAVGCFSTIKNFLIRWRQVLAIRVVFPVEAYTFLTTFR